MEVHEDEGVSVSLLNPTSGESVVIALGAGGRTDSIRLLTPHAPHVLVDVLDSTGRFPGSLLAPWPNRIDEGTYVFESKTYSVPINEPDRNTSLHGLMYDRPVAKVGHEVNSTKAEVTLEYNFDGKDSGYPFLVSVHIIYRLFADYKGMECEIQAINMSDVSAPFAFGWHPYFRLSADGKLSPDHSLNDLLIRVEQGERLAVNDRLIPTGLEPFSGLDDVAMGTTEYDTGFKLRADVSTGGKYIETHLRNTKENLDLVMWQDRDKFPYLQIYTPPTRHCIAIEPMSHATNCFKDTVLHPAPAVLTPGGASQFKGSFGVRLV
eukprot:TRINITY_DN3806_c0_g1_i1.p1 TRINITY_DN3806_c0_g1~~TRINITY_DN3806_c0_g1_i1.p1  ORF type:complete len:336 (-),score=36.12 TRINITY_DN3806_c0_g1_i1:69-1031(-)